MKRAPLVLGATAAGLAAVLSFHTSAAPLTLGLVAPPSSTKSATSSTVVAGPPSNKSSSSSSTPPSTVGTSSVSSSSTSPSTATSSPSTSTVPPSSTSTSSSRPASTSTSTSSPSTASKTVVGPSVNYNYGTLSVSVTAVGNKITNLQIASLNDGGNFRSQSIDQQSIPILEQQALAAQSANIQGVSGASYTSAGFARSLQSALSTLGLS